MEMATGDWGEDDAEDEDDDEDEVPLLPRRSERAWNRGGKGKRSRYSQSRRDSTAKRQRHLHLTLQFSRVLFTSGKLSTVLRIEAMTGLVLEEEEDMGEAQEENVDSRVDVCVKGVLLHE